MQTTYKTIERAASAEYSDRGSRFHAYAYPFEAASDLKALLAEIRGMHPKATHICFAYRLGSDAREFRSFDDGEPSGSAGRPILGQIDSRGLTQVLVVVVRYFGGTLLGIPGLIQAYRSASALALQLTPVVERAVELPYCLQFDYTMMHTVMQLIKQCQCRIRTQDLQLFCQMDIDVPKSWQEPFLALLADHPGIDCRLRPESRA